VNNDESPVQCSKFKVQRFADLNIGYLEPSTLNLEPALAPRAGGGPSAVAGFAVYRAAPHLTGVFDAAGSEIDPVAI
jgi:hypothetical protein